MRHCRGRVRDSWSSQAVGAQSARSLSRQRIAHHCKGRSRAPHSGSVRLRRVAVGDAAVAGAEQPHGGRLAADATYGDAGAAQRTVARAVVAERGAAGLAALCLRRHRRGVVEHYRRGFALRFLQLPPGRVESAAVRGVLRGGATAHGARECHGATGAAMPRLDAAARRGRWHRRRVRGGGADARRHGAGRGRPHHRRGRCRPRRRRRRAHRGGRARPGARR
mmetsp:Transcript_36876/g.113892  ORF Transcript_36876/g.113892 Transcript_36876/m.113892 type:complete len:222 (-) Transcript_36876:117-782(-)